MKKNYYFLALFLISTISLQAQGLSVSLSASSCSCNGMADGSVQLTINGGASPYTILWSTGVASAWLENLNSGWYSVTVTDTQSNVAIDSAYVSEPAALLVSAVITDATAIGGSDGSISVSISGGTSPYNLLWENGSSAASISNLYGGSYSLTVTDGNSCEHSESFFVNAPVPAGWNTTSTSVYDLVTIENNNCTYLDSMPLAPGSPIGVFYDNAGTEACAGFTIWNGNNSSFFVYGQQPGTTIGMPPGTKFNWKVYDVASGQEKKAWVCADSVFVNWGMSAGTSYTVHCLEAYSNYAQTLNFVQGQNLFALTVKPDNFSVADLFAPYVNDIKVISDDAGNAWWPEFGINTLGDLQLTKGYRLKANAAFSATIYGDMIFPEEYTIFITSVPVLFGCYTLPSYSIPGILPGGPGLFFQVVSEEGNIYYPLYNVNTIINLVPGEGYLIYGVQNPFTIQFPPNPCY